MNSLQKKRQSFRQSIRSRSIQQLFSRKRQQLLQQLRQRNLAQNIHEQNNNCLVNAIQVSQVLSTSQQPSYTQIQHFLNTNTEPITIKDQQQLFLLITNKNSIISGLQKISLLSQMINRKQFFLDQKVQTSYGWKRLVEEIITVICEHDDKRQLDRGWRHVENKKMSEIAHKKTSTTLNLLCLSLIKIWQLKPKPEHFFPLCKVYHHLHNNLSSNSLSLTLIAELSYEKSLLPSYQFITNKLLTTTVTTVNEMKLFRVLEILKNFISGCRQGHNVHPRQLVFEYVNWIKMQVDLLLSLSLPQLIATQQQHANNQHLSQSHHLPTHDEAITPQTRYCLIYLLFTTLNKLFEINETERQHLSGKEILLLNEQLLTYKENHTMLKFLILQGKQSVDSYHKRNIFRTLSLFLSFLEIAVGVRNNSEEKSQNEERESTFEAEIEEIQKTFQGTELDWFGSFC